LTTTARREARTFYDCTDCPAYCCAIYSRVEVTDADLKRLARHLDLSLEAAEEKHTKRLSGERVLRRQKDDLLGEACSFLDLRTRACTIYHARPLACRAYPGRPRCAYYDVLQFEREIQDDETATPLVQITFQKRRAARPG
jgi:uncharacterized protein